MTDDRPSEKPKRTILYYPTISVPTGTWLRQALLYWDEIGSIVPQRWDDSAFIPYTPDIEYLRAEGEFRPFRPETLIRQPKGWEYLQAFEKELQSTVTSVGFQRLLGPKHKWQLVSHIHHDKVSHELFDFLAREGLATVDRENPGWYLFEGKTALLYMSVLAKYLADIDIQATVPGTDRREYEKLIYDAPSRGRGFACLDTRFRNALPIPRDDVPLSEILEFKRRRRAELLNFRQQIGHFQKQLSQVENRREVKQIVTSFGESIEKGLNALSTLLSDAKIETTAGSLKTIINAKSPTLWGTLGVIVNQATKVMELPIQWTLPGLGVLGLIEVGYYLIDKRNERRATLRNSPFAYLYHAQAEGLL